MHRTSATGEIDETPNILVLSDLHLGEDVKPNTVGYLRHVARLERELEDFLDHYTRARHDGRPWRLIVNGDMVDFLSVCLLPSDSEGDGVTADERRFGLGTGPKQTQRKLEEVIKRHPGVFRKLARFVAAANELVIILGNHDVEFYWDEVQEAFKAALHRFACEGLGIESTSETRSAIFEQISFHPWFYYEPDLLYVEHGHQYDEYCSFDYILNPVAPRPQDGILSSVAATGMRYFCNLVPDMDPHRQEEWTALGYLRWAITRGMRGLGTVLSCYCFMMWRMLSVWRDLREGVQDARRRKEHLERLRGLAAQYKVGEDMLLRLEALKRPTVLRDFFALVQMLCLDRVALAVCWMLGVLFILVLAPAWKLGWVGALTALTVGGNFWLARGRDIDPAKKMARIPQAIWRIMRAPLIVFGHSHDPVAQPLEGGAWYFNTGTWVASERPGLLHAFTHLVIRHTDEGARAQLCQWRNGDSAAYQQTPPAIVPKPAFACK